MNLRLSAAAMICVLQALTLAGCGEEEARQENHTQKRSGLEKPGQTDWIGALDDVRPEIWLVAHEAKVGVQVSDDDKKALAPLIAQAAAKFKDTPRMIVNRAVQLEQMLKEVGGSETAIELIRTLTETVPEAQVDSFGGAAHHYFNVRKVGMTPSQSLSELSKRYELRD